MGKHIKLPREAALLSEFFSRPCSEFTHCRQKATYFSHRSPKRARHSNLLFFGGYVFEGNSGLPIQLPHGSLSNHAPFAANQHRIHLGQIERRDYPHLGQLSPQPPPNSPDIPYER